MVKFRDVVLLLVFLLVMTVHVALVTIDSLPRSYRLWCCSGALLSCVVLPALSVYDESIRAFFRLPAQRDLARRVMSVGQWQTLGTCVGLSLQKICFVVFHLWRLKFRLETWTPCVILLFVIYTLTAWKSSMIFETELRMLFWEQLMCKPFFFWRQDATQVVQERLQGFIRMNQAWNAFWTNYYSLYEKRYMMTEMILYQEGKIQELDQTNATEVVRKEARDKQTRMEDAETTLNTSWFLFFIVMPMRIWLCLLWGGFWFLIDYNVQQDKHARLDKMRDVREQQIEQFNLLYKSTD